MGMPGEDVQNEGHAVDYLNLQCFLQALLLERRQFVVKDDGAVAGALL